MVTTAAHCSSTFLIFLTITTLVTSSCFTNTMDKNIEQYRVPAAAQIYYDALPHELWRTIIYIQFKHPISVRKACKRITTKFCLINKRTYNIVQEPSLLQHIIALPGVLSRYENATLLNKFWPSNKFGTLYQSTHQAIELDLFADISTPDTTFDPDYSNKNRHSLLANACRSGIKSIVTFLLDNKADPNLPSAFTNTNSDPLMHYAPPLFFAIAHPSIVKLLIDRGARIDDRQRNWDYKPLSHADCNNLCHTAVGCCIEQYCSLREQCKCYRKNKSCKHAQDLNNFRQSIDIFATHKPSLKNVSVINEIFDDYAPKDYQQNPLVLYECAFDKL